MVLFDNQYMENVWVVDNTYRCLIIDRLPCMSFYSSHGTKPELMRQNFATNGLKMALQAGENSMSLGHS